MAEQRLLKPLYYRIIVDNIEFKKVIPIYSRPQRGTKIIIRGLKFIVMEDEQNLDMYVERKYLFDKAPETVIAIPYPPRIKYTDIQEMLRFPDKSSDKWDEAEVSPEMRAQVRQWEEELMLRSPKPPSIIDVIPLVTFFGFLIVGYVTHVWVWVVFSAVSAIWITAITPRIVHYFRNRTMH